jgi:hypothetical protein
MIASQICETPIANNIGLCKERQWVKSTHWISSARTPRDLTFCMQLMMLIM